MSKNKTFYYLFKIGSLFLKFLFIIFTKNIELCRQHPLSVFLEHYL
jgi:hypothetical protein